MVSLADSQAAAVYMKSYKELSAIIVCINWGSETIAREVRFLDFKLRWASVGVIMSLFGLIKIIYISCFLFLRVG